MKRVQTWQNAIAVAILISLFLISMLPVAVMFVRSWKTLPQVGRSQIFPTLPLHYGNYVEAWALVSRYLVNTVLIVLMSTRKPGPESPSQQVGFADQPDDEGAEVERPAADEADQ